MKLILYKMREDKQLPTVLIMVVLERIGCASRICDESQNFKHFITRLITQTEFSFKKRPRYSLKSKISTNNKEIAVSEICNYNAIGKCERLDFNDTTFSPRSLCDNVLYAELTCRKICRQGFQY